MTEGWGEQILIPGKEIKIILSAKLSGAACNTTVQEAKAISSFFSSSITIINRLTISKNKQTNFQKLMYF